MFSTGLSSEPLSTIASISINSFPVRFVIAFLHVHAENTGSAPDIENNLILENVAVLVDRVTVRSRANVIFL